MHQTWGVLYYLLACSDDTYQGQKSMFAFHFSAWQQILDRNVRNKHNVNKTYPRHKMRVSLIGWLQQ